MLYMWPRIAPEGYGYIASAYGQIGRKHLTRPWCCDNGVYTGKFIKDKFINWLKGSIKYIDTCKFVVAPDVLYNWKETLNQYPYWLEYLHFMGYPVAYAVQDGQTVEMLPDFDALFVGGSTKWKLSTDCILLIKEAQKRKKWVHVGRVNTLNRIGHCISLGVDSVDGTHPCYEPDRAHRRLTAWLNQQVLL